MSPRLIRRDGSIVFGMRNPDGTWFEVPLTYDPPGPEIMPTQIAPAVQPPASVSIREFLRKIGRLGGQARAARHGRTEIAAWGRVRHGVKPRV